VDIEVNYTILTLIFFLVGRPRAMHLLKDEFFPLILNILDNCGWVSWENMVKSKPQKYILLLQLRVGAGPNFPFRIVFGFFLAFLAGSGIDFLQFIQGT